MPYDRPEESFVDSQKSAVSGALYVVGALLICVGFYIFVEGLNTRGFGRNMAVGVALAPAISGILFIGFGRIVQVLEGIADTVVRTSANIDKIASHASTPASP